MTMSLIFKSTDLTDNDDNGGADSCQEGGAEHHLHVGGEHCQHPGGGEGEADHQQGVPPAASQHHGAQETS